MWRASSRHVFLMIPTGFRRLPLRYHALSTSWLETCKTRSDCSRKACRLCFISPNLNPQDTAKRQTDSDQLKSEEKHNRTKSSEAFFFPQSCEFTLPTFLNEGCPATVAKIYTTNCFVEHCSTLSFSICQQDTGTHAKN